MEPHPLSKEALSEKRDAFDNLLQRRYYVIPSFSIYGGKAGLYDYGPPGSAIKANVEKLWREHFVIEDDLMEIQATCVTPEEVLIASGHVEKFDDVMVKDSKKGDIFYRCDHLIEEHFENLIKKEGNKLSEEKKKQYEEIIRHVESYSKEKMGEIIKEHKIKSPKTGNDLAEPIHFNLMFGVQIGPTGDSKGYLRPETAQGMFVNFKQLLDYNGGRIPFGCAQIGQAYRNEVAPKSGIIRLREFTLAEIEYFVDPNESTHSKLSEFASHKINVYSKQHQKDGVQHEEMTIGTAIEKGIIENQTLAYYIYRTDLFLKKVGIQFEGVRYRQHKDNELAHYSKDCWDAELMTSYGWIECVGIANRSAFDLTKHAKASKKELMASRKYKQPIKVDVIEGEIDRKFIGKTFKQDNKPVCDALETLDEATKEAMLAAHTEGKSYELSISATKKVEITKECFKKQLEKKTKDVMEEKYVPYVIEPAFGVGRIIYAMWEQNFKMRTKERTYISLPPKIAPYKCSILTVVMNKEFEDYVEKIRASFKKFGISHKVDSTGQSIGKRYARTDELGIPFGITIDHQTLEDNTVTLREINTTDQVRIPVSEVTEVINALSDAVIIWKDVATKYPKFEANQE